MLKLRCVVDLVGKYREMKRVGVRVALVLGMVAAGCGMAWGQAQNTGSIVGSVTDPTGAVIVNATVTATEPAKGVTRTVQTSKSGEYFLPNLPVGNYILTVTMTGFDTYVNDNIIIDADASQKIGVKLTVGNVKDTIEVKSEGVGVDTRSATIATLIDTNLVENLPISGDNIVALAGLLPGVTDLNAPPTNTKDTGGATYGVSGSRNTQNLMLFDGLMWNNLFYNTGVTYPPRMALQEISVQLNNFKAQYGRNAGSVFNVITKSGSNAIHGSVWDHLQNQMFNAADYFSHVSPEDNSNQFGFTLGGPIKRDKAYFFTSFQDLIQHLQAVGTVLAPGPAERGLLATCKNGAQGLLDTAVCADGSTPTLSARPCNPTDGFVAGTTCANFIDAVPSGKVLNPYTVSSTSGNAPTPQNAYDNFQSAWYQAGNTGVNPCWALLGEMSTLPAPSASIPIAGEVPNAEIPSACLNPVMSNVAGIYGTNNGVIATEMPLPNAVSVGALLPETITVAPLPKHDLNVLGRVDYNLSSRHTIDARYNLIRASDGVAPGATGGNAVVTYEIDQDIAVSNFGNIADTWIVTSNVVNVLRVGYKRYTLYSPPDDQHTLNSFGGNFFEPGTPVLPSIGISNYGGLGSTGQANNSTVNEDIEVLEQINWTHGNHNLQFGVNFLRLQYLNTASYPGSLGFSVTYTGNSLSDAAMGLLNSVTAKSQLVQAGINHSIFSYLQDDWRATAKLTLNLGVRYELPFQWYQPTGYSSTFIPGHESTRFPNAVSGLAFPGDPGVLNSLVPTDFNGVVPRIGFAYDVFGNGKLALRGGFGMFFDAVNANVVGVGEPFYYQFSTNLPPGGFSVPLATFGTNPNDTRPNGNVKVLPGGFDKTNPQFAAPYTLFFPDKNFRTPYYEAMNLGFQYRVPRGGVLDVNVVTKLGRKLTMPYDQNPAIVDCSGGYYQANPTLYASSWCPYQVPGSVAGTASSATASENARLRFTPFLGGGTGLVDFASVATSNYNGLQAQYTQRGGKLLTLLGSYTYSKSIDMLTNAQSQSNSAPDVFDLTTNRGASDYDARHVGSLGWVLNFPRVVGGSALERIVLNNWVYSGTFQAHTGKPYSVTLNGDIALDDEGNQRAQVFPGMSLKVPGNRSRVQKINEWFNTAAVTYPAYGTFGNMQRNSLYGPGYLFTQMSFGRIFPMSKIREGMRLQFRAEAFNVFNTVNLANPQSGYSCSSTQIAQPGNQYFGKQCSVVGTPSTSIGAIRGDITGTGTFSGARVMEFSGTIFF